MPTSIPNNSVTTFRQAWAPVKWAKQTTLNDYALRVTNTVGVDSNTTGLNFSTGLNQTVSITGSFNLSASLGPTVAGLASHSHTLSPGSNLTGSSGPWTYGPPSNPAITAIVGNPVTGTSGPTGGGGASGGAHTHTFTNVTSPFTLLNTSINIKYIDIIIATRTG